MKARFSSDKDESGLIANKIAVGRAGQAAFGEGAGILAAVGALLGRYKNY
jgi:hypothetical protein